MEKAKDFWRERVIEAWNMKIDTPMKDYLHRKYATLEEAIEKEVKSHEEHLLKTGGGEGKPIVFSKETVERIKRMGGNPEQLRQALERAREQEERMRHQTPKEILKEIVGHQLPASVLTEATIEANIGLVGKMLKKGMLRCPYCGGDDLVWSCCGKRI